MTLVDLPSTVDCDGRLTPKAPSQAHRSDRHRPRHGHAQRDRTPYGQRDHHGRALYGRVPWSGRQQR